MRGAKKRQALPAIVLLLLASAGPPPGAEGRNVPAAGAERGALLDILLQALGDDGRPPPPRPPRRDRVISRRYSGSSAPPAEPRAAAAAPRPPPAAAAPPPPRVFAAARHGEIFPRDSSLKDKFIKHFTGPVTFSSECSKHFHRLYHNTRDCSTPTCQIPANGRKAFDETQNVEIHVAMRMGNFPADHYVLKLLAWTLRICHGKTH